MCVLIEIYGLWIKHKPSGC